MKILEEFWYGNIDTADYGLPHDQEYKELYRRLCDVEERLKATMNDEQKKCSPNTWMCNWNFCLWKNVSCSRIVLSWVPG